MDYGNCWTWVTFWLWKVLDSGNFLTLATFDSGKFWNLATFDSGNFKTRVTFGLRQLLDSCILVWKEDSQGTLLHIGCSNMMGVGRRCPLRRWAVGDVLYCTVGWSDVALFSDFLKMDTLLLIVYIFRSLIQKNWQVRTSRLAKFSFSKNHRDP